MDERRVLLIGKRAGVLTRLAAALRARGIAADEVRDPTGAGVDPSGGHRVVAFGRAVKPADRDRLRRTLGAADPEVVFVDGYAPIVELLVAQCEQALDRRPLGRRAIVDASVRGGIVDLELRGPCRLRITSYRLDGLYRTHTRELFDRAVRAGTHSAALDPRAARSRHAFVVIRADDETVALAAG
ncbi:hypothetical protein KDL01_28670 [Actinospica durhamensis]|uniref:Uncharacterized protein n=1 Tax=Actinospica durhamensis TaxID=1508375 RepID=A0A941EU09_9ACTN|nr:hypothetical protein [Actinospica durhamensis]MBR7837286.1 hypothetical protein [Actinospica durhamensis]